MSRTIKTHGLTVHNEISGIHTHGIGFQQATRHGGSRSGLPSKSCAYFSSAPVRILDSEESSASGKNRFKVLIVFGV